MDKRFLLIVALSLLFTLTRSWEPFILFTDELYIEEVSYRMAKTHDFLIPHFGSAVSFIKPPLYSWLTAPLYWFFPPSPFIRRFWTLAFGMGLAALSFMFVKKYYSSRTAFWSTFFVIGNGLYVSFTKTANLDIPNACLTLLVITLYNFGKKNPRLFYFGGFFLGISILNRSLLALIPLPIIIIDLLFFPKERPRLKTLLIAGCWLLIVGLPWHLFAYYTHPQEFITHSFSFNVVEHVAQLAPGDRPQPWWYYITLLSSIPAAWFSFVQFMLMIKEKKRLRSIDIQLLTWLLTTVGMLSLIATRHAWYILPALPPLAILAGQGMSKLITSLQEKRLSLWRFLLIQFTAATLIAPFGTLLLTANPNAETITALDTMMAHSDSHDSLYTYRYPWIYTTALFHPREIAVIEDQAMLRALKKGKAQLFVLVQNADMAEIRRELGEVRILFQGDQYALIVKKQ